MKVALVHYHLEPGGVTRVLENTVQSWKNSEKVQISGLFLAVGLTLAKSLTMYGWLKDSIMRL